MTTTPQPDSPVLIVDDNEDARDALAYIVKAKAGVAHVVCAGDGLDALERLQAGLRPSVILLDLYTPRMDGLAFRMEQLADPALRDIPVILYSAAYDLHAKAVPMGLSPHHVLRKPIDFDQLCRLVARYCTPSGNAQ